MKNFIQIGTNKGYDDFTMIVKKYDKNEIFLHLVEPIQEHNESILKCYEGYKKELHNIVIDVKDGETEIYKHPKMDENLLIASTSKDHVLKHGGDKRFNDDDFITIKVKSKTFNTFIDELNITDIEYLFIDAEGLDYEILRMVDYGKYTIKNIIYENLHVHNPTVIDFLRHKGYRLVQERYGDNGWSTYLTKI